MISGRVLVTGGTGFVGKHLVNKLLESKDIDIVVTSHMIMDKTFASTNNVSTVCWNTCNCTDISQIIDEFSPEYVIHMAAQSSVSRSWDDPESTFTVNTLLARCLLDGIKKAPKLKKMLLVGSSEEYGIPGEDGLPLNEEHSCIPVNPYGLTKMFQNQLGSFYYRAFGLPIVQTRSFNHIGPGQDLRFVIPSFCKQAVDISKGIQQSMSVGNISIKRDFTDVRDVINAYISLLCSGEEGETYNVGNGRSQSLTEIIRIISEIIGNEININIDNEKKRSIDVEDMYADVSKILRHTQWRPSISMNQSLTDIVRSIS